jgi:hypothetical protein
MKLFLSIILFTILSFTTMAQQYDTAWHYHATALGNFSQSSLSNWQGGGQNNIAGAGFLHLAAKYQTERRLWETMFDAAYGLTRLGDRTTIFIKSDDALKLLSQYSYSLKKPLYLVTLADFRTTFSPGYKYKKDTSGEMQKGQLLSNFMAPGYLILSEGIEYRHSENFFMMLAPFSGKFTFVLDKQLSNEGAFGVPKGKALRAEFGANFVLFFRVPIAKNIEFQNKLNLFDNYKTYDAIDVTWDTQLLMKINSYLTTTVTTNLIYDEDIKIVRKNNTVGPITQFKEVLAIGFQYKFR